MAQSISEEELQLKKRARRRLIGAIVVVTVVAVGLPMVLDQEPKPVSQEITIQIPSPDSGAFKSKVVPLGADGKPDAKAEPAARPAAAPLQKPEAVKSPAEPTKPEAARSAAEPQKPAPATEAPKAAVKPAVKEPPKKELPKPAAKEEPKPVAKEAPKPAAPAPAGESWVVQVAALSDAAKAKAMQESIAKAGMTSYTEVVAIAKGNVTRVRAGPYPSREAAEKAREQLKGIGLDGKVVPK